MKPLLATLLGLVLVGSTSAQPARFDGWDRMRDPDFVFDPDERTIRGFSVRQSLGARADQDEVERALAAGDAEAAAAALWHLAARDRSELIPVAGTPVARLEQSRWVGAAEWALYQLESRVPDSVARGLARPEDARRVETAIAWRDDVALRELAWELGSLPEGRAATEALAKLLVERGEDDRARAALRRAVGLGSDDLAALAERLAVAPADHAPALQLPAELEGAWQFMVPLGRLAEEARYPFNPFLAYPSAYEARFAPLRPRVEDGIVYVADSISVSAHDLISGRRLWHHVGPLEQIALDEGGSQWFSFETYAQAQRPRAISPYQVCAPTLTDELVLATVQVPERLRDVDTFDSVPIDFPLPWRRLVALDRRSGEVVWTQERADKLPSDFENRFDVAGPAVVDGGVVYASGSVTQGAITAYLAAFDERTGDLLWRTLLCSGQQELTMFNRPFQEHVVSPPLVHDGAVFVSTNLGVISCVDAWSGNVRWATAYESIPRRSSRGVRPNNPRPVYWLNQPPFVEAGTLFIAPLDSEYLLPLDPATGRRRFDPVQSEDRRERRHHFQAMPTGLGHVLLFTREGVAAVDARTGRAPWPHRSYGSRITATGAATRAGELVLVPTDDELLVLDPEDGFHVQSREWPATPRGLRDVKRVISAGAALVFDDGRDVVASLNTTALRREIERGGLPPAEASLALGELALADDDLTEARARFEAALDSSDAEHRARAASGRLETALRVARRAGDAADWEAVLEAAGAVPGRRAELATEALLGLGAAGDGRAVARWLTRLAEDDPRMQVELGPDGRQPVEQLALIWELPFSTEAEQVDLLQTLIERYPDGGWNGVRVHDEARRRQARLLASIGREAYAHHERTAAEALAAGADLEALEKRYPNAEVVSAARLADMDRRIAAGDAAGVLEEIAVRGGAAPMAPRIAAARQLGEHAYVDLLEGRAPAPPPPAPRLPVDGAGALTFELSDVFRITFRDVSGQPAPEFAGYALACVDGAGEMVMVDSHGGRLAWSGVALPGGLTQASAGVTSFHMEGDLLIARGRSEVVAHRLADGSVAWRRTLPGLALDVVSVGGVVLSLAALDDQEFRVDGYGVASGTHVLSVPLPPCSSARLERAGDQVIVFTRSRYLRDGRGRDTRLLVLDLAAGELASSTLIDDALSLVTTFAEPPLVLLTRRETSRASRLVGWDPRTTRTLWERPVELGHVNSESLLETGPGRFAVRQSVSLPGTRRRADAFVPADAAAGPADAPSDAPVLDLVTGQAGERAPRLVLRDEFRPERLVVLSGETLLPDYELLFDEPLDGHLEAHHGRDGFVLVSETDGPTSIWVVRGEDGRQRYSTELDDLPAGRTRVQLVDGAVLVAAGGKLRIIRRSGR